MRKCLILFVHCNVKPCDGTFLPRMVLYRLEYGKGASPVFYGAVF